METDDTGVSPDEVSNTDATDAPAPPADAEPGTEPGVMVRLSPSNLWRIGLVLLGVVAFGLLIKFVIDDGGSVIFTVLMSWFAAIAMAPVVDRLSRHMRRGLATGIVMATAVVFIVVFFAAFGSLFVNQLTQLVLLIPDLVDGVLSWINGNFSTSLSRDDILSSVNLSPQQIATVAASLGISLIGFLGSVVGSVFGLFTFGLFVFYLSADMPRFERWIAGLFPARSQKFVATVWGLTAQKTGGYVGARVVLAAINSITTGIVFVIIDMPYWLPLALWTGIVAQFVPTIGTYISIILPVVVGLLSPNPWIGIIALVWAVLYQQVENLTIEPKISAKAVDLVERRDRSHAHRLAGPPVDPVLELDAPGGADLRDAVLVVDADHDLRAAACMLAGEDGHGGAVMPGRLAAVPVRADRIEDVGFVQAERPGQVGCARLGHADDAAKWMHFARRIR